MTAILIAVMTASLLGSLHCVGMCGPLAVWAIGANDGQAKRRRAPAMLAYHAGRLTTYLSAGLVAGSVGSALTVGGDVAGIQSAAAKVAGGLMIAVGLWRLASMFWSAKTPAVGGAGMHRVALPLMRRLGPAMRTMDPATRAFAGGLVTTWLPCGWLYLFVLAAAGSGSVPAAVMMMAAFWAGTLPALTGVMIGASGLVRKAPRLTTLMVAVLLIGTGTYTATGRAAADLTTLSFDQSNDVIGNIEGVSGQPLPCCCHGPSTCGGVKP